MQKYVPRSDVGGGGLAGAFFVLYMLTQGGPFDFSAVGGAIGVLISFALPYVAKKFKSLAAAVSVPVAALLAGLVGMVFFGVPFDPAVVSAAMASLVVAAVTYLGRPLDPETPLRAVIRR